MKNIKSFSKLSFFILFFIGQLFLYGCAKEKRNLVPDTFVNITINLNNYPIGMLQSITLNNFSVGVPTLGYNNNGIIIFRGQDEFFSYDRTCPYHLENSTAVNIENSLFARCPVCNSLYQLFYEGFPSEGPSSDPLKRYETYYNPNTMDLTITNFK